MKEVPNNFPWWVWKCPSGFPLTWNSGCLCEFRRLRLELFHFLFSLLPYLFVHVECLLCLFFWFFILTQIFLKSNCHTMKLSGVKILFMFMCYVLCNTMTCVLIGYKWVCKEESHALCAYVKIMITRAAPAKNRNLFRIKQLMKKWNLRLTWVNMLVLHEPVGLISTNWNSCKIKWAILFPNLLKCLTVPCISTKPEPI